MTEHVPTADVEITSETESQRPDDMLRRAFPEDRETQERGISEVVVVRATQGDNSAPAGRARPSGEIEPHVHRAVLRQQCEVGAMSFGARGGTNYENPQWRREDRWRQ